MWDDFAAQFGGREPRNLQMAAACVAVAVSATLLARWMPRGTGLGLGITSILAALLLFSGPSLLLWVTGLLALAGAIAAGSVLRATPRELHPKQLSRSEQSALFAHAGALLVIWASASTLGMEDSPAWALELALATALALAALWAQPENDNSGGVSISLALLAWIAVRTWRGLLGISEPGVLTAALLALLLAIFSCVCALWLIWDGWQYRKAHWLSEPDKLLDPSPVSPVTSGAGIALGVGALLCATIASHHVLSPVVVLAAGLALCSIGHLQRQDRFAGPCGLLACSSAWLFAAWAWLPDSPLNTSVGVALAASFSWWLAKFWRQQLHDGLPWTTAGRLIEVAREQSQLGGLAVLAAVIYARSQDGIAFWMMAIALLAVLLLFRLHGKDARAEQSGRSVFASGAAGLALAGVLDLALRSIWPAADLAISVAAVAILLSVQWTRVVEESSYATACNAYLGAVMPGVVIVRTLLDEQVARNPLAWLGLALVVGAGVVRWARTRPRSEITAPA